MTSVKTVFGTDNRRVTLPQDETTFDFLLNFIQQSYTLVAPRLTWVDEEGDHILIVNPRDLEEAIAAVGSGVLKVFVDVDDQNSDGFVELTPTNETDEEKNPTGPRDNTETEETVPETTPENEAEQEFNLCKFLEKLTTDENLQQNVVEGATDVFTRVTREKESLLLAFDTVIAQRPALLDLAQAVQHVRSFLPAFEEHVAHAAAFLQAIDPGLVGVAVRNWINTLKSGGGSTSSCSLMPMLYGLLGGQMNFGPSCPPFECGRPEPQQTQQQNGPVVHDGVTCDNCGASPITGARFKCAVCPNFDLCSACEDAHPNDHPLIKLATPTSTLDRPLVGAAELIHAGRRRGRGRGGRCGRGRGGKCGKWGGGNHHGKWHRGGHHQGRWNRGGRHHGHGHHGGFGKFLHHVFGAGAQNADGFDSKFIGHVTMPHGSQTIGSTTLIKTWRVKNTGANAWDSSVKLVFFKGDAQVANSNGSVLAAQPNEEVDVSVALDVPKEPGVYRLALRLEAAGVAFGDVLKTRFRVLPEDPEFDSSDDNKDAEPVEPSAPVFAPEPESEFEPEFVSPEPVFEHQEALEALLEMGFKASEDTLRALLKMHNGTIGGVISALANN